MSVIITRPIGSRFKCNGVELEVVENLLGSDGFCEGCYFDEVGCWNDEYLQIRGNCSYFVRDDCKDVCFRRVRS